MMVIEQIFKLLEIQIAYMTLGGHKNMIHTTLYFHQNKLFLPLMFVKGSSKYIES